MTTNTNTILTHQEITHKIRRIAYQIYESNIDESEIVLAGIDRNGYILAEKLKAILDDISPINSLLCNVIIDKKTPLSPVKTSLNHEDYKHKSVILIDDVLNSGTTLAYSIKHFLNVPLKQFKTAILVNRSHKKYPVKADFKGISLSTSLHEHIYVSLEDKAYTVVLE